MSKRHTPTGPRSSFCVDVWEERDRLHVSLKHAPVRYDVTRDAYVKLGSCDETVADWWDEDARQMFEDGFFKSGRGDSALANSVIDYAESVGLIRLR